MYKCDSSGSDAGNLLITLIRVSHGHLLKALIDV